MYLKYKIKDGASPSYGKLPERFIGAVSKTVLPNRAHGFESRTFRQRIARITKKYFGGITIMADILKNL